MNQNTIRYNSAEEYDSFRPIDSIAESAGLETAEKIVSEFGGTRIYIPKKLTPEHELCALVGFEKALVICSCFCGERVDIPLRYRTMEEIHRLVPMLLKKGYKIRRIARMVGMSERTVFRILRKHKEEKKPPF